jgi:hypothetical protein
MVTCGLSTTGILFTFDSLRVELQLNSNRRKFVATKTKMIRAIFNNISIMVKPSSKYNKKA